MSMRMVMTGNTLVMIQRRRMPIMRRLRPWLTLAVSPALLSCIMRPTYSRTPIPW